MISQGELALAQMGVSSIIDGEAPKMGIMRIENALALPKRIPELARQAVRGKLKYYPEKRKHKYTDLLERMAANLPQEEIQQLVELFPSEAHAMASEFSIIIQHTLESLKQLIPVSTITSFTGPRSILPSDDRLWKFFNQLELLNDPLKVFNMISVGALLKSQSEAVQEIYPTVSDEITKSLYEAVAEAVTEKEGFRLAPRVEYGLGNWLGRRTVEYQAPRKQEEPAPRATHSGDTEKLETANQKSMNP